MQSRFGLNQVCRTLAAAGTLVAASAALANPTNPGSSNTPPVKLTETGKQEIHKPADTTVFRPLRGPGQPNDNCDAALPITPGGSVFGDTTGATPSGEAGVCAGGGLTSAGVWYTFTGNGNSMNASTCGGAAWDTVLRVVRGSCFSPICVAYNDDACGLQSQTVNFNTIAGETYYIYVSAFGAATVGQFTLTLNDFGPPPPAPPNDDCINAISVSIGGSIAGYTTGGNPSPEASLCAGAGLTSPGVWYTFTGNGNLVDVTTCGLATWDTVLRVVRGSCFGATCVAYNDDACGLQSRTPTFPTVAGETYYIYISAFGAATNGNFTIQVNDLGVPPPPVDGDECANALQRVVPFTDFNDTTFANPDFGIPACGVGAANRSLWYSFEGTGATLRATTCDGAAWDTALAVFTGDCNFLTCVASNDDACGLQSRVVFPTNAGQTYYVVIRGWSATSFGPYALTVEELPPPCEVVPPPGAIDEGEPDCGIPDFTNGGCNSAPPIFGTIACGQTIYGSGAFNGSTRDTDWFHFTLDETTTVTFTVAMEFNGLIGFLETNTASPTGDCSEYTGFVNPFGFPVNDCQDFSITTTLGPGVWTVFVAPVFGDLVACGGPGSRYIATLTFDGGCGGGGGDCNGNGIDDGVEIAGNPALDCYNPLVLQNPNVMGGSDGIIDACQCAANWNRDGAVNSTDLSTFITSWLAAVNSQTTGADINCSGTVNSTDLSAFITLWLSALNNTVPYDGCP